MWLYYKLIVRIFTMTIKKGLEFARNAVIITARKTVDATD